MEPLLKALAPVCGLYLIVASACAGDRDPLLQVGDPQARAFAPSGPVLARVGGSELHLEEVRPLARAARDLRRLLLVPVPAEGTLAVDLGLAIEFLALAETGAALPDASAEVADEGKRALVRLYLDRALAAVREQPVSDADIKRAHLQEIERYYSTLESDLYMPTRVDAVAIAVGRFPSLKTYSDAQVPDVLPEREAIALAEQVRAACGDRVLDLDDFLAIGRRMSKGHPTLRLETFRRVNIDARLARLPRGVLEALLALDGNGAISQVIWSGNAAYVIRRGVTYPGRGERWEDIRDELSAIVVEERLRQVYEDLLKRLQSRFPIVTNPEVLDRVEERRRAS